jgi:hypothetical protein
MQAAHLINMRQIVLSVQIEQAYMLLNKEKTGKINNTSQRVRPGNTPNRPVKIGSCLQQLMQKIVEPKTEQYQTICRIWEEIMPDNLRQHCKIVEIDAGTVKVQADSPSYVFELRMNSRQLLKQMQKEIPRLRIKSLKFVVGQRTKDGC